MKLADEFRRECRRSQTVLYYEALLRDMRQEAREGGAYKVIQISPTYYNVICKKLITDGFDVRIYNFKVDNPSHMVYIIWDKEKFEKILSESEDINLKNFHYGLI